MDDRYRLLVRAHTRFMTIVSGISGETDPVACADRRTSRADARTALVIAHRVALVDLICRCWECNSRRMPSPMPMEEADRVLEEVHEPKLGRRALQPNLMGQSRCYHLAEPVCARCQRDYHTVCTGWSWPNLHETWIADHHGSSVFWDYGSHYLVWTPPRRCACGCFTPRVPTVPPPPPALRRPSRPPPAPPPPVTETSPASVEPVQPTLFDVEVTP